jgi:hypothetical protein
MRIPCLAAVTALLLTVLAVPASAADVDFSGIVDMRNCSGSVVRTPSALSSDPALVMSNGHCLKDMAPGEVVVDEPSSRSFTLLDFSGAPLVALPVAKVAYATMTGTDVAFHQLRATYACRIDEFVPQLREDSWTWTDSIRYTSACHTIPGTSGSPIVAGGKVIGVNNTLNEDGESCTRNNPCEVAANGDITVRQGIAYGQQTYHAVRCIGAASVITLTAPGCGLPRP